MQGCHPLLATFQYSCCWEVWGGKCYKERWTRAMERRENISVPLVKLRSEGGSKIAGEAWISESAASLVEGTSCSGNQLCRSLLRLGVSWTSSADVHKPGVYPSCPTQSSSSVPAGWRWLPVPLSRVSVDSRGLHHLNGFFQELFCIILLSPIAGQLTWECGGKIFSIESKLEFDKPLPSGVEEYQHSWKYVYVHLKLS